MDRASLHLRRSIFKLKPPLLLYPICHSYFTFPAAVIMKHQSLGFDRVYITLHQCEESKAAAKDYAAQLGRG